MSASQRLYRRWSNWRCDSLLSKVQQNTKYKIITDVFTWLIDGCVVDTTTADVTPEVTTLPNTTDGSGSGVQLPTKITIELIPGPPRKNPCNNAPHKVYESIDSEVDQIAIESTTTNNVDVYAWSTSPVVQHDYYNSKQFAQRFLNVKFNYTGSTTEGWHITATRLCIRGATIHNLAVSIYCLTVQQYITC